jgi:hypothetical protein
LGKNTLNNVSSIAYFFHQKTAFSIPLPNFFR